MSGNREVTGVVKNWFSEKGYGFVKNPHGPDVFLHVSRIKDPFFAGNLAVGMKITVDVEPSKKGLQAVRVITLGEIAPRSRLEQATVLKVDDKGFAFVRREKDLGDAFVHKSVWEKCGIAQLQPDQVVVIRVAPSKGGKLPRVTEIDLSSDRQMAAE